ncbi:MAG: hypothetical protein Q7T74_06990 [Candidatus Saccharibacteria bacterium]|nr:hypothetical protein [Candidatus Saccharibacteria bacterium]
MLTKNFIIKSLLLSALTSIAFAQTAPTAPASPIVASSAPLELTVPLSEAGKTPSGNLIKPGQVQPGSPVGTINDANAIRVIDERGNYDLRAGVGSGLSVRRKQKKEIELIRTALVEGEYGALIRVNGITTKVKVGSPVLKYIVSTVEKDSICLKLSSNSKAKCSKTIVFDIE